MTHTRTVFLFLETQKLRKIFLRHSNYNANAPFVLVPPVPEFTRFKETFVYLYMYTF